MKIKESKKKSTTKKKEMWRTKNLDEETQSYVLTFSVLFLPLPSFLYASQAK